MVNPQVDTAGLLVLPHLQIQNANAISGPFSWGFPPPSAFLGFAHALERKLLAAGVLEKGFAGVGVVCHRFEPQVTRLASKYQYVFHLSRNPTNKDGTPATIVEEGRVHLDISLVIAVKDELSANTETTPLIQAVHTEVNAMRFAGGSILPWGEQQRAYWKTVSQQQTEQDAFFKKLRYSLLPGFALVHRPDKLRTHLDTLGPNATVLDALLDLTQLNIAPATPDPTHPEFVEWQVHKPATGWLVPLPIGYAGLSPLHAAGEVTNTRDAETPTCFVECLYSLGEWIAPHRLTSFSQMLWRHQAEPDTGLYRCVNFYTDLNPFSA